MKKLGTFDFSSPPVFHVGESPDRIDFLTKVQGLNFDEAQKLQVYFDLDGKRVPVLNFDHLIISKLLSNRPQDKADIDVLQKSQRLKNKEDDTTH